MRTRALLRAGTPSTWAQRARSPPRTRLGPIGGGGAAQPSLEGAGGRGAHLSLIRKDKDIPAAAAVLAALLRQRRARLLFLGPGHRLSPAGAARCHHDRGRAGG